MKNSLEGLISKTKSHLKKATFGAIILTSLSGNSAETTQDTQETTYNYFSQEANQSSNFSQSKQGLYKKFELEGIISTGNYQTESPQPRDSMTIKNSIEQSPGKISFSYSLHQNEQTRGQRLFEENSSRTNVYFAVPRGALEGIYQEVSVFDYSKKERKTLFATDGANQRLEEQLGKFNRTIAKLKGKSSQNLNEERNEYEITLDSAIDLAPGKIGLGLKAGKGFLKKLGQKNEEKRIQNLQEKFGEDYEIIRMPSNSTNGKLSELFFTHGITGRKTILIYSPEKIKEDQKIHISAPNLTFTKIQNGLERTTEIGGLEYEITPNKEKNVGEEIYGDWVKEGGSLEEISKKQFKKHAFKTIIQKADKVTLLKEENGIKYFNVKNNFEKGDSDLAIIGKNSLMKLYDIQDRYAYDIGLLIRNGSKGEPSSLEKFYGEWKKVKRKVDYNLQKSNGDSTNTNLLINSSGIYSIFNNEGEKTKDSKRNYALDPITNKTISEMLIGGHYWKGPIEFSVIELDGILHARNYKNKPGRNNSDKSSYENWFYLLEYQNSLILGEKKDGPQANEIKGIFEKIKQNKK